MGGFTRSVGTGARFCLNAAGEENPVLASLAFFGDPAVDVRAVSPPDWWPVELPRQSEDPKVARRIEKAKREVSDQIDSDVFPCRSPGTSSAMPVRIAGKNGCQFTLQYWADGSSRSPFMKLYSGNRSALDIIRAMIRGTTDTYGVTRLWELRRDEMVERPFDVLTPMKGSFNFDPRGGWTALDAGYSLDSQKHQIAASPVVEILAAAGMEHARPRHLGPRRVGYTAWGAPLPVILARAALAGDIVVEPTRSFEFTLALSGKNKVATFAREVGSD